MVRARWFIALTSAALLGGCGDSTGPGDVTLDDLVGNWQVTKWEYTNSANTSQKVDLASLGGTATLTVANSGAYVIAGDFGGGPITLTGTYAVSGGKLVIHETGTSVTQTAPFTLSGSTWTITGLDGDWDFNDDGEDDPATLIIVFTRQ